MEPHYDWQSYLFRLFLSIYARLIKHTNYRFTTDMHNFFFFFCKFQQKKAFDASFSRSGSREYHSCCVCDDRPVNYNKTERTYDY